MTELPMPPRAKQVPHKLEIHGDTRIDPWFWLNDRDNPEVIAYLEAENAYLETQMAPEKAFRESLYQEMLGRIKQEDQSVPFLYNGYYYITRYETGQEYPIYTRKKGHPDAPEEILLDVNVLAEGQDYYDVSGVYVSPDNQWMAFGVDTVSRRLYTLHLKNLHSGVITELEIPGTSGSVAWANDSQTFFYTCKNPQTLRHERIKKHRIGQDPTTDQEVYFEADDTFLTFAYKSKSEKYIIIGCSQTITSDYYLIPADDPDQAPVQFTPRIRGHEYQIDHRNDEWLILSNADGATNFRVMSCPDRATQQSNWQERIPHRPDVLLESIEPFARFWVLEERKAGLTQFRIFSDSGAEHYLDFGEEAYTAYISVNRTLDTPLLRFGYQSMTTPPSTYDYDVFSRDKTLLKQQEVLGGFEASDYLTRRWYAPAHDGVQVPISLVYHKDTPLSSSTPVLLYAYGSYGITVDPTFSSARLSLLNRGFVFAIAHIRGGQLLGREWYDHGKLLDKKNTFRDFISCAEHLIREGLSSPEHLYAMGGSAGGLLMGAIANMRPDLWKGIVAAVPFVDVVTTMLDESIPLTTGEFDEWGNPKDPVYYHYIKSYSPYDNVEAQAYPAMLVTTGLHDSQVQYWEPAKWVAKLRERKTDENLLLLYTNMDAGHGGASGRFQRLKEIALEYVFLFKMEGLSS